LLSIAACCVLGCGSAGAGKADIDEGNDISHDVIHDLGHEEGCAGDDTSYDATPPMACNGHPVLCDRRYNEVAFVTTHNAMANEDDGFLAPNHYKSMRRQMEDGVRAMMLDTHYDEGVAYLCHGYCVVGKKLLADGLKEIRDFLSDNPNEVFGIIFEAYVSEKDTAAAFQEAGLMDMVHLGNKGAPWPTLRQMISEGRRLVVLSDKASGKLDWYMKVWDVAWETDWDNQSLEDFTCKRNRGKPDNPLFILNHFLTDPLASPELAAQANANPFFLERAEQCMKESGRLPNFVAVDFYSIGDVFQVVDVLNGVQ